MIDNAVRIVSSYYWSSLKESSPPVHIWPSPYVCLLVALFLTHFSLSPKAPTTNAVFGSSFPELLEIVMLCIEAPSQIYGYVTVQSYAFWKQIPLCSTCMELWPKDDHTVCN